MAEKKPIKVLVVGSEDSGKGLLLRQVGTAVGVTQEIGIRFFKTKLDDQTIQFWEWVGADNPRSPKPGFYEGASGACVVYDVRSLHSFEQAKVWIRVLQADYNINSVLLLANYCKDEENRIVFSQDGRFLAGTKNFLYFEVDPNLAPEIEESFRMLVQNIAVTTSH